MKIVKIKDEMNNNKIVDGIINQNLCIREDANIKIIVKKNMKNRWLFLMECDPDVISSIMSNEMCINFSICAIFKWMDLLVFKLWWFSSYCKKYNRKGDTCVWSRTPNSVSLDKYIIPFLSLLHLFLYVPVCV